MELACLFSNKVSNLFPSPPPFWNRMWTPVQMDWTPSHSPFLEIIMLLLGNSLEQKCTEVPWLPELWLIRQKGCASLCVSGKLRALVQGSEPGPASFPGAAPHSPWRTAGAGRLAAPLPLPLRQRLLRGAALPSVCSSAQLWQFILRGNHEKYPVLKYFL